MVTLQAQSWRLYGRRCLMLVSSQLEKEAEHRRILFKAAARADVRAQEELEREYHVRIQCKKPLEANQHGKKLRS